MAEWESPVIAPKLDGVIVLFYKGIWYNEFVVTHKVGTIEARFRSVTWKLVKLPGRRSPLTSLTTLRCKVCALLSAFIVS